MSSLLLDPFVFLCLNLVEFPLCPQCDGTKRITGRIHFHTLAQYTTSYSETGLGKYGITRNTMEIWDYQDYHGNMGLPGLPWQYGITRINVTRTSTFSKSLKLTSVPTYLRPGKVECSFDCNRIASFKCKTQGESYIVLFHISQFDCLPLGQGHQKPVYDTRDMSGIQHSCLGCVSQVHSL